MVIQIATRRNKEYTWDKFLTGRLFPRQFTLNKKYLHANFKMQIAKK